MSQKSGTEEGIALMKHSAMGKTEEQLYECFWHFTTNWNLGIHKFWIDDTNGKIIYRSRWFTESELEDYSKAAYNIARMCNHNWINECKERNKDGKRTECSSSKSNSRA